MGKYSKQHLSSGVGSGHDSLYKFKKAFNRGDDLEFWIGKKVFSQDVYDVLVGYQEGIDVETQYFPKYRFKKI